MTEKQLKRFKSRFTAGKPDECWNWQSGKNVYGYGILYMGEIKHGVGAHRIAWEVANGPIPEGAWVLHKCDNRACVNPAHLFIGDAKANAHDCMAKGRSILKRGEQSLSSKLKDAAVQNILSLYAAGMTYAHLEKMFGVTRSSIGLYARGSRQGTADHVGVCDLPIPQFLRRGGIFA